MEIRKFACEPSSTYRRLIENLVYLGLTCYGNWIWWTFGRFEIDDPIVFRILHFFFLPFMSVYVLYYAFVRVYEFTRMMTYVQIDTDADLLRMRNLWKTEVEVSTKRIQSIKPVRPFPLTSGWKHLALVDESGYKHIIHHNVEPLGECMEAIRKLCPNLQKVDYGGLDKHGLWTIRGKM